MESALKGQADALIFAILLLPEYELIGITSLARIDWIDRNSELAIFISKKELWGQSFGTEALVLL